MAEIPFHADYEHIINSLQAAHDDIATIQTRDISALRGRILTNLKREINSLSAHMNIVSKDANALPRKNQPLGRVFGRPLATPKRRAERAKEAEIDKPPITSQEFKKKVQATTEDVQGKELQHTVSRLYGEFTEIETDKVKDSYADIEILGVAKMAGLPVTENTPVNIKFIEQIKEAIRQKRRIAEQEATLRERIKQQTTKPPAG